MPALPCLPLRAAVFFALTLSPAFLATAEEAEKKERKFFFNAYVTQAWGETDGGQVLGLDEDGTFDYNNAALLGRYQLTKNDRFVVQLSHESIGNSPLGEIRDDLELDWAFYEHRFPADFQIRAGRVPIPFGIYNEIRDVGTLLEFYRPPIGIYFEGAFSAEAVDGVVLSKSFFTGSPWSLDADVYAGSWDRPEYLVPTIYEGEAKNGLGTQLWLHTPVEGLEAGIAYQRFDQKDGAAFFRNPDSDLFETWLVSLNADFERFVVRGEWQQIETSFVFVPKVRLPSYYVLAGLRLTDQLELYGQVETSSSRWIFGSGLPTLTFGPQYEDRAVSFLYRLSPKTLIRVEGHHYETTSADVPLRPGQASVVTDFAIVSFTWSY